MRQTLILAFVVILSISLSGCASFFDKKNKSGLQVLTNEQPSSIFLDGQYLEKTPYINQELKPGQYSLKIEPEDSSLAPYETTINLGRGLLTVVTWKPGATPELSGGVFYELEKLSSTKQTELSIITIPDGAVISIDSAEKEFSPVLKTEIKPGTHSIAVSLPSYDSQNHTINVVEGHRLNILITLAKSDATEPTTQPTAATTPEQKSATSSAAVVKSDLESVSLASASANGPTVTITSTNFFQDGQEVLRVRDAIGTSGKELGFAPVDSKYPYLSETVNGWYKINFNGKEGWVSGAYAKLDE